MKRNPILQVLNDLSTKHLIKLILYENGEEGLYRTIYDVFGVWHFDYWYLKWIHQGKRWNGIWWKSTKAMEYDKLYPSGSGTPKMQKFSSSDSFRKLCPIVSSRGTFNYNLTRFLCDLLSPLVPNDY